jgi:hypothetical protein
MAASKIMPGRQTNSPFTGAPAQQNTPSPSSGGGGGGGGPTMPAPQSYQHFGAPATAAPAVPPPLPAPSAPAAPAAAASSSSGMMMAGLGNALRDPGEGWQPDGPQSPGQEGLGTRTSSQPMDILRQIVGKRGKAY